LVVLSLERLSVALLSFRLHLQSVTLRNARKLRILKEDGNKIESDTANKSGKSLTENEKRRNQSITQDEELSIQKTDNRTLSSHRAKHASLRRKTNGGEK